MKKIVLLICFLFVLNAIRALAQNNAVESARVAFITQKVNLTPAQAEKFWPLYNELQSERSDIRKTIRGLYDKMDGDSEQTTEKVKSYLDQLNQLKIKEANLEKNYYNRFLLVISSKQLVDLLTAEREFQKILLKKVASD